MCLVGGLAFQDLVIQGNAGGDNERASRNCFSLSSSSDTDSAKKEAGGQMIEGQQIRRGGRANDQSAKNWNDEAN